MDNFEKKSSNLDFFYSFYHTYVKKQIIQKCSNMYIYIMQCVYSEKDCS